MRRRDFWKIVLTSGVLSAALVLFFLRWPVPERSFAEPPPAVPAAAAPSTPLTDEERVNIDVYQRLSRGVVNITSTTLEYTWFFEPVPRQGVGSGVILDEKGHIVTNYHVIEDARRLEVTLHDEQVVEAKVVGQDPINDLAILKIECPGSGCSPIPLGTARGLQVGQRVLAIGNPFGFQSTLTTGIVSSLGRSLRTEYGYIDDLIQTDAAINPGNSGGPLLNASGQLIGINTAIFSRAGDSAGIGFAVPVDTLKRVLPDLLEYGRVQRPWFGATGRALWRRLARALELPVEEGFLVERVEPGSSADRAGLRGGDRRVLGNRGVIIGGDVITEMGGRAIASSADLVRVLEDKKPGDRIEIVYYRDGRRVESTMELVGRETGRRFRF